MLFLSWWLNQIWIHKWIQIDSVTVPVWTSWVLIGRLSLFRNHWQFVLIWSWDRDWDLDLWSLFWLGLFDVDFDFLFIVFAMLQTKCQLFLDTQLPWLRRWRNGYLDSFLSSLNFLWLILFNLLKIQRRRRRQIDRRTDRRRRQIEKRRWNG